MWIHHLMLKKHCFRKYLYTSFLQTSLQRREWWCPQCWGWRGICAGYSGRVLLWDSPLHQTISVPTPSKKQRTVPLFSCLCNIKEEIDKEEEGCLKTLENAKVRKKDGEIFTLCRGEKPWSLIVLALGEGDLHDQKSLELNWLSSGLLTCLKAQVIEGRSKIIHWSPVLWDFPTWGRHGGSCVILKVVCFHDPFFQRFCAIHTCSPK